MGEPQEDVDPVEVTLNVLTGDGHGQAEVRALLAWLREEDELRGAALHFGGEVREDQMGIDVETLTVILGPAGAGASLLSAVNAFLATRRSVKVRVEGPKGVVELDGQMTRGDARDHIERAGEMTGLTTPLDAPS